MPTYLTPAVYVEEISGATKPLEGVSTSTAAFVGLAPGGPINTPVQISNWTQFTTRFGDRTNPDNGPFMPGAYLAHAVYGFFQNGGSLCWVVRVGRDEAARRQAALPAAGRSGVDAFVAVAQPDVEADLTIELTEEAPGESAARGKGRAGGAKDESEDGEQPPPVSYRLEITAGDEQEVYTNLTLEKGANNIVTKTKSSKLVAIQPADAASDGPLTPAPGTYPLEIPVIRPEDLAPKDYEGDVAHRKGLGGLMAIDAQMICVPDLVTLLNGDDVQFRDQQGKLIAHCESAGDRMAILDPPPDLLPQEMLDWRTDTAGYDSKYATLYYPWAEVIDPLTSKPLRIPPCGHVAGVWARTDANRGVHKAPANEVLMGVNALAFQMTQAEQGPLNRAGVNCIRSFPARGIRVWGARTLSSDAEWRYLNVRRLFNYIARTLNEGMQWAVFEPNDAKLWMQLRIAASNFLTRTWREGALFGATPQEAFYVKCDEETNPPDVRDAGQVVTEIGIAPVKPAEFVIFRLTQYTAGDSAE
jgi:phage tail sheath protein FI